ncbi:MULTISPECIES: hypothetical protein [Cylindrospermopsis]|jgi:hypothetical protein|uniref:hypothetical protein n=1 Tax=Cylindrospermopsis TaxID=77021 RepID=UPI001C69D976|nr:MULTISPECIES: hypothetical protein [Cylindrospermopsis]UJS05578.1 hypothetical protein L3I90_04890 [Cylindrospermopsis raciborskii KLL07]
MISAHGNIDKPDECGLVEYLEKQGKTKKRPIAMDLFSGAGGLSLGILLALMW